MFSGRKVKMDKKSCWHLQLYIVFIITPIVVLHAPSIHANKPTTTPIRVACVGDSITQITKYTADLQAMLGPNYTVATLA